MDKGCLPPGEGGREHGATISHDNIHQAVILGWWHVLGLGPPQDAVSSHLADYSKSYISALPVLVPLG